MNTYQSEHAGPQIDAAVARALEGGQIDTNLTAHEGNTTTHITAAERTGWNGKAAGNHTHTKSQITDFPKTDATPTTGSANLVTSGGVAVELAGKVSTISILNVGSVKDILAYPSGIYQVAPHIADMPLTGRYWHVTAVVTSNGGECTLRAEDVVAGVIYTQTYSIGVWRGWKGPIATAVPPVEYDLPLAAGWSALRFRYRKTQDSMVTIDGCDITSGNAGVGTYVIGTLPEGYRPEGVLYVCVGNFADGAIATVSELVIMQDGTLHLHRPDSTASRHAVCVTFRAAY